MRWVEPSPVDVIIPAYHEGVSLSEVARAVDNSMLHGQLIIVENVKGKGNALLRGLEKVQTDRVAFFDADLLGITGSHVDLLLSAPAGAMTCGTVTPRWPLTNLQERWGTVSFSGERVLPTWLARATPLEGVGYGCEAAFHKAAAAYGVPVHYVHLNGIHHKTTAEHGKPFSHHVKRWSEVAATMFG